MLIDMDRVNRHTVVVLAFISLCALHGPSEARQMPSGSAPKSLSSIEPVFQYLTRKDGLPENSVTCILQDHLGYLWLGTQNGLVRYDGYTMDVFQPRDGTTGIGGSYISSIYEDHENTLWVTTMHGLKKFNRANDSLTSYCFDPDNSLSINSDKTRCVYEDASGRLWIGTHGGLNEMHRDNGTFAQMHFNEADPVAKGSTERGINPFPINAIIEDPETGNLLIGTSADGLRTYDFTRKRLTKYPAAAGSASDAKIGWIQSFTKARDGAIWMVSEYSVSRLDPHRKTIQTILEVSIPASDRYKYPLTAMACITEDHNGFIWAGFWRGDRGIFRIDPQQETWEKILPYPNEPPGSNKNKIYAVYEDRSGILWTGVWLGGLVKWNSAAHRFAIMKHDPGNPNSISDPTVYSLEYDSSGYMWFNTQTALDRYDLKHRTLRHYLGDEKSSVPGMYRTALDAAGNVWLSTEQQGLIRFNPKTETLQRYLNNAHEEINLVGKNIRDIQFDHIGFLWIATDGSGLYRFDVGRNEAVHFVSDQKDRESLSSDRIEVVYEDRSGTMWFGTVFGGMNRFDRNAQKFTRCGFGTITALHEDILGNFWMGEYTTGLNLYDRGKDSIIANYSHSDGLACDAIQQILEDDHNNLWLPTENGLSRFNVVSRTFKNLSETDGLPSSRFRGWYHRKSRDGSMYLITEKGVVIFHPDSIRDDPIVPQIVLKRISLFNKPGEKLDYKGFISELKEMTIPYHQNDLRFDFVALQFNEPARNTYKYTLENFDKGWVDAGTQRNATYTNLDPGTYIFRVKAANRDGVWNERAATITITITPPWWKTPLAYALYAALLLSSLYGAWRVQMRRVRIRHEFQMSRFEAEKLHEVDELKSRFFTNISHEFRTPLTLILGPVKQIAEQIKDQQLKEELGIVHRNAGKLLGLVNQLLDISKLESGTMKVQTVYQDVIPILRNLVISFTPYAERKNTTLKFSPLEREVLVYIDREKIEKVCTNLLSNALKFTPAGGIITLSVSKDDKTIMIAISDTGIGIPKDELTRVFDRFYQVDGSHTREGEGTGIGLALTKELVELHKGTIEVESEEGKGTVVTIRLPLGKDHLTPDEIVPSAERDAKPTESSPDTTVLEKGAKVTPVFDHFVRDEKCIVLLVEDNADVRHYIRGILEHEYRLLEAADGEQGWNMSVERIPDVIVSDVMMPMMDGFELCAKLKRDERTSHIPVILLTAKAAHEDKIQGIETGADAYITKPFEPEEVQAQIQNLIEQRKRLHEYFKKHGFVGFDDSEIVSIDKKFLRKVFHIIEENISDSSLTVESLADMAAVSSSVLRRKIVSLTGEPPVDLIRRVRLMRAAELIGRKFGNMAEIALEVGFTNPAYFSECFKKQFGVSPSQYTHIPIAK